MLSTISIGTSVSSGTLVSNGTRRTSSPPRRRRRRITKNTYTEREVDGALQYGHKKIYNLMLGILYYGIVYATWFMCVIGLDIVK
jgi:hypothetical protein